MIYIHKRKNKKKNEWWEQLNHQHNWTTTATTAKTCFKNGNFRLTGIIFFFDRWTSFKLALRPLRRLLTMLCSTAIVRNFISMKNKITRIDVHLIAIFFGRKPRIKHNYQQVLFFINLWGFSRKHWMPTWFGRAFNTNNYNKLHIPLLISISISLILYFILIFFRFFDEAPNNESRDSWASSAGLCGCIAPAKCMRPVQLCIACQ